MAIALGTGVAAAGDVDGQVRLFDLAAKKEKTVLKGHAAEVRAVAFGLDGKWLARADLDGKIKVWDAEGKEKYTFEGHKSAVLSLAFASDGKLLASGGIDGEVRLWNAETGKEVLTQLGRHDAPVYALAFAPDGKTLVGGCGREVHCAGTPRRAGRHAAEGQTPGRHGRRRRCAAERGW